MRLDTIIRGAFLMTMVALAGQALLLGQKKTGSSSPPEMLVTEQGFLAINTPRGWIRSQGPGLACFVPKSDRRANSLVLIYISSAPIGPDEDAKDANTYVQSDIADFKERFKSGTVKEEEPLVLPKLNTRARVHTFRSGEKHNTIEQVVYIAEVNRVLTLVLSSKEVAAYEQSLPVFRDFARSYRGSIVPASDSK